MRYQQYGLFSRGLEERQQNNDDAAGGDGRGGFRMVRKCRCMSGSLDRPRGHSRLLQPPKLPPPSALRDAPSNVSLPPTSRNSRLAKPHYFLRVPLLLSSKWVPFRKPTPTSLRRPSPSSSSQVSLLLPLDLPTNPSSPLAIISLTQ